jgi:hypothetical protein
VISLFSDLKMETNFEDFSIPNLFLNFEWTRPYEINMRSTTTEEALAVNNFVTSDSISEEIFFFMITTKLKV